MEIDRAPGVINEIVTAGEIRKARDAAYGTLVASASITYRLETPRRQTVPVDDGEKFTFRADDRFGTRKYFCGNKSRKRWRTTLSRTT